eukprot:Selendium_serpulae@DN4720_c1_g2_i1.p1
MGSDIYWYKCLSKTGKKVILLYKSAQDGGLGPNGKDEWTKAFWISAVLEFECGAWDMSTMKADCSLAKSEVWRSKNGELKIEGCPKMEMKEYQAIVEPFGSTTCVSCCGDVSYSSVEEAENCKAALNGKKLKNKKGEEGTLKVEFKNLTGDGPDYINHYEFDHELFDPFLDNVEELHVDFVDDYANHGYWETCGTYELTFSDEKWCEHLKVGKEWYGR